MYVTYTAPPLCPQCGLRPVEPSVLSSVQVVRVPCWVLLTAPPPAAPGKE